MTHWRSIVIDSTRMTSQRTVPHPPAGLEDFLSLDDFAAAAKQQMPNAIFEYVDSGAGDEYTMRWNRERWSAIKLKPRVLRDVSQISLETSFLGQHFRIPILLAPTAYQRLYHPEGELATIAGANAAGVSLVLASFASHSVEEIAKQARRGFWFQLYVQRDRELTRSVVQRVEA